MNERIKELVEQEMIKYYEGEYADSKTARWNLEEFAELIVRECQLRVEQYINDCGGEVSSIPDTVIMKHFGVNG
jgi:hypothetical protein